MELQEHELCRASGLYESPRLLYGSSTFNFATHRQDFEHVELQFRTLNIVALRDLNFVELHNFETL